MTRGSAVQALTPDILTCRSCRRLGLPRARGSSDPSAAANDAPATADEWTTVKRLTVAGPCRIHTCFPEGEALRRKFGRPT